MTHRTLTAGSDFTDLDANVREFLPVNSTLVKAETFGTAAWTRAARITVSLEDGKEESYFLKCASEDIGRKMLEGEYDSLKQISKFVPGLAPDLYGIGKFRDSVVPTFFILMTCLELETGPPEPVNFMKQLADLHINSVSPTGQFGYHMTTTQGPIEQDIRWHENWSFFYGRMMRQFYDRELSTNGPSPDGKYEREMETLIAHSLPNLLGPLQTEGRTIKPCLVHGDLWEENCGTDLDTGEPKIFDPAAFFAHNEYEFGMWRSENVPFGRPHYRQYFRHFPPSEPKDQWDDRNKIYSMKFEITCSALWPAVHEGQRKIITGYAADLNSKYANSSVTAGADKDA